jgi:type I restriction enzyme M protein
MRDPRIKIVHGDDPDYSLITRSSDGQMLFLANMVSKMNHDTPLGSRIAEVHNGSSLFTGDAGQGESNIRRWIIENDWLEAIVALPLNMFYNTGIATYVWVLSNRKPKLRQGKMQLTDATQWFKPLRKNLGKKNCEFSDQDIQRICEVFLRFEETPQSKIFPNQAFGYWKITVERPLRFHSQLTHRAIESLRFASGDETVRSELFDEFGDALFQDFDSVRAAAEKRLIEWGNGDEEESEGDEALKRPAIPEKRRKKLLDATTWKRGCHLFDTATALQRELGDGLFDDHNIFRQQVDSTLDRLGAKVSSADLKLILRIVSWRVEGAPPVVANIHKANKTRLDPLHGFYEQQIAGKRCVVEYEPDPELRDTEQVSLSSSIVAIAIRANLSLNSGAAWCISRWTTSKFRCVPS